MKRIWIVLTLVAFVLSLALVGCTGTAGTRGSQGTQGTQGEQGIQGLQGNQGIQGQKGDTGKQGEQGKTGEDGDEGDRGLRGYEGDEGEEGDRGTKGDKGNPGLPGTNGIDGINGTDGIDGSDGNDGNDCEFQAFLLLAEKDSGWDIVKGGAFGYLLYNPVGDEFEYEFEAWGLEEVEDYSLIYYADPWPGDNPGCLIAKLKSNSSGYISESGEKDLGMSLPNGSDDNIDHNSDYDGSPDWYAHTNGAKIWLVLSDDYGNPEMTEWNPGDYLFETDLITYIDTDYGFYNGGS